MLLYGNNGDRNLISVIIPSYNDDVFLEKAIKSCKISNRYGVELIVVCPIRPVSTDAIWIRDNGIGIVDAMNIGFHASHGEYVTFMPADWTFNPKWTDAVQFVKDMPLKRRNRCAGLIGWGYPKQCGVWMSERSTLYNDLFQGNIFNPAYYHHYVDCDTSLMLWIEGEEWLTVPDVCPVTTIQVSTNITQMYDCVDNMIFNEIWWEIIENKHVDNGYSSISRDEQIKLFNDGLLKSRYYPKTGKRVTLHEYYTTNLDKLVE